MELRRSSFRAATGWCFPLALMLRSIAAGRERRRFHSPSALRCVSKHEGHVVAVLILRDALTRVRPCGSTCACALLRMRTASRFSPSHDVKQPISFPRRVFAPGSCNFASLTPNRGVGGAPRNVRVLGGTPVRRALGASQDARERAYDAARQALARRLASHDAGRSPLGAPPRRFWASGPRFRLLRRPPSYNGGQLPSDPCSELLAARS